MNIKAIPISTLFTENEDLYEKIVVASKRHRQIVDSRSIQLEAFEDIEDTEQLEQFEDIDYDIEKPLVVSIKELMDGDLEWTYEQNEELDNK